MVQVLQAVHGLFEIAMSSFLKLHAPDGLVVKTRIPHNSPSLLEHLPSLFSQRQIPIPNASGFHVDLGASSETHVFVAREHHPPERDASGHYNVMDVFAVKVEEGGKIREDEVFNKARSHFSDSFAADSGGVTAYYFDGSYSEEGGECLN